MGGLVGGSVGVVWVVREVVGGPGETPGGQIPELQREKAVEIEDKYSV